MVIVMRAVVGLTAIAAALSSSASAAGPFLPSEMPLLGEFHGERKRLSLPRLGKHRPAVVARESRQRLQALEPAT